MKTVYWSPFFPFDEYPSVQLMYDAPVGLLNDIKDFRNSDNKGDNFYQCHAFLNSIRNTFVLKLPFDITFGLDDEYGAIHIGGDVENMRFVVRKQPSQQKAQTFAVRGNWIFWSEEPLDMVTSPAHYHPPVFDGFYVGGQFNINSWFRPIEGASQLHAGVNTVSIKRNDPIAYVKFLTSEPVELKRFYMTKELEELSWGCIKYKRYEKNRALPYLYDRFRERGLHKVITRLVKENVMES
jgi:hypothetical protein